MRRSAIRTDRHDRNFFGLLRTCCIRCLDPSSTVTSAYTTRKFENTYSGHHSHSSLKNKLVFILTFFILKTEMRSRSNYRSSLKKTGFICNTNFIDQRLKLIFVRIQKIGFTNSNSSELQPPTNNWINHFIFFFIKTNTESTKKQTLCTSCNSHCWDILRTRFSLILGTWFSILGTRIGSLKHLKKLYIRTSQIRTKSKINILRHSLQLIPPHSSWIPSPTKLTSYTCINDCFTTRAGDCLSLMRRNNRQDIGTCCEITKKFYCLPRRMSATSTLHAAVWCSIINHGLFKHRIHRVHNLFHNH